MEVRRLTHLYDKEVMVHLDYSDPPESIWIIRRYARFYRGYTSVELSHCHLVVDEEIRREALDYPKSYKLLSGWIEGRLLSWDKKRPLEELSEINYHPWKEGGFFLVETGEPISEADYIYFDSTGKAYILNETQKLEL